MYNISIGKQWYNYAESGLAGYAMLRKYSMGRRRGGVLLNIDYTIPAYEVQLH